MRETPASGVRWEHFAHEADIGVRGYGTTQAQAFEQAAYAMTAVITEAERVLPQVRVNLRCSAPDPGLLLFDWLNSLIYNMSTRNLLFSEFSVRIDGDMLRGSARGETVDIARHQPRVEIKGATFTELDVNCDSSGQWLAQCVLDV